MIDMILGAFLGVFAALIPLLLSRPNNRKVDDQSCGNRSGEESHA